MIDLGLHSIAPHIEKSYITIYVAGDFGKMHTAKGEALDIVAVGDVHITLLNRSMRTLQQVRHVLDLKKI